MKGKGIIDKKIKILFIYTIAEKSNLNPANGKSIILMIEFKSRG